MNYIILVHTSVIMNGVLHVTESNVIVSSQFNFVKLVHNVDGNNIKLA